MPKGVYVRNWNPIANIGHRDPVPWTDRFWPKVEKTDGCWLWTGAKGRGYGKLQVGTLAAPRWVAAHRLAYELEHGPIAPGVQVLHRCDTRACVRPDHLFVGTSQDNMTDKVEKGRQTRGASHPFSKLTAEQVREIRALGPLASPGKLAQRYGVKYGTIRNVLRGFTYQDVS